MKTLYLDIGNSFFKLAEKKGPGWEIVARSHTGKLAETVAGLEGEEDEPFRIISSSVRRDIGRQLNDLLSSGQLVIFTTGQIPPEYLDYDTPETLGIDRYLACLGATAETDKPVVVVDAGTACTVDLMTADMVYRGGVIMPGLRVYRQAMKTMLPELPQVDQSLPGRWPGKTTEESMKWGVNGAFFESVVWFIRKHLEQTGDADVFITGGDADSISQYLAQQMQVNHRPHLVFGGMYEFEKMKR